LNTYLRLNFYFIVYASACLLFDGVTVWEVHPGQRLAMTLRYTTKAENRPLTNQYVLLINLVKNVDLGNFASQVHINNTTSMLYPHGNVRNELACLPQIYPMML